MVKILSIGNSFSEDAHTFLAQLCQEDGIEIKAVCPFIGGHTFKRHLDNVKTDEKAYELLINGQHTGKSVSFMEALCLEKWDIVTFNQGSVQAGRPVTYIPHLQILKEMVSKQSPTAKLYIYQTWSYESDSTHPYFPVYNSDQREMWIRTRDCYQFASRLIDAPIIPVGEVIQYMRENIPEFDYKNGGLSLNRDGYHLSEIYGRYAAGLTFYGCLFDKDVKNNKFIPRISTEKTDEKLIEKIREAVLTIINRPPDEIDE